VSALQELPTEVEVGPSQPNSTGIGLAFLRSTSVLGVTRTEIFAAARSASCCIAGAEAEVVEQLLLRDPSLHRRSGQPRHRLQAVRPKLGVGVAPVASTGTLRTFSSAVSAKPGLLPFQGSTGGWSPVGQLWPGTG
jgi:hypothetical protein